MHQKQKLGSASFAPQTTQERGLRGSGVNGSRSGSGASPSELDRSPSPP